MSYIAHRRSIAKVVLSLAAVAGFAGFTAPAAHADSLPSSIHTLQDLVDSGSTGVNLGNLNFYGFQYLGNPSGGANPAPTPAQITVTSAPGANSGLEFTYAWESDNGFDQESRITYCIRALSGNISAVQLHFNGTAPIPGVATNASVNETVQTIAGAPLGTLSTFDDGTGASTNNLDASLPLSPALDALCVIKDIRVVSGPIERQGGVSTISIVDNTFVPEPGTLALGTLAGGSLLLRRRRNA